MTGGFDFPPASASSNSTADINSIPARFQSIRQTLQRERDRDRISWDAAAAERSREVADMPPITRSASHRRPSSSRGVPPPFRNGRRVTHASEGPSSSLGRRPRTAQREAHPMSRARRALTSRVQYASLHPALERHSSPRLDQVDTTLNDLLDPSSFSRSSPFPNLEAYLANGTLEDYEEDESRQRLKRRKLDHTDTSKDVASIEYGHFGQVVAGPLKMEIVACDGGQLRDDNRMLYRPENVLRNDKSVYCTEQPRCSLLLTHHSETSFALEKLIIKGPDKGFTAPIQEGLVFVSMSSKGLMSSAYQYNIQYTPVFPLYRPGPNPHDRQSDRTADQGRDAGLTLLEAINDAETWDLHQNQHEQSSEDEGGPASMAPDDEENEGGPGSQGQYGLSEVCEWATGGEVPSGTAAPENPNPRDFRAPTPPPPPQVRVTTDVDESNFNDLEEDTTAADVLADRVFREARWRNSAFAEDLAMDGSGSNNNITTADDNGFLPPLERMYGRSEFERRWNPQRGWVRRHPAASGQRVLANRRVYPSTISARPAARDGDSGPPAPGAAAKTEVEPQARFFIPEDKSAVAVKFDPPICGRYILLKMFGPQPGSNIDVQSIIAYGYAGQRFFPAFQFV